MSTNDNDNPKTRQRVAGYVNHAHKHLTPEQRGAIVNATIAHKDLIMGSSDAYDAPASDLCETMIGFAVRSVLREKPELNAAPVNALTLAKAIRAEYENTHGATMPDAGWLETLKNVEAMDGFTRLKEAVRLKLELTPASDKPKQVASSKAGPRLYRDMSPDELDVLTEQRLGTQRHTWTVKQRSAYHDALKASDPKPKAAPTQFDQAASRGLLNRPLTAQERIAAHRRAEAAKATPAKVGAK